MQKPPNSVSILIEDDEPPDTEVPDNELWSFQIVSNYDSINPDGELRASKRTTIGI